MIGVMLIVLSMVESV